MTYCIHQMIPETCSICRGKSAGKATKIPIVRPVVKAPVLVEATDDIVPRRLHSMAPTIEEMREAEGEQKPRYLPVHPDEEEKEMSEKAIGERVVEEEPMCPRCHGPTTVVLKNGNPGVCLKCRNEAISAVMRGRKKSPKDIEPVPEHGPIVPGPPPPEAKEASLDLDFVKELVDAHWKYVSSLLRTHGETEDMVTKIGFHYCSSFLHGFKHGVESSHGTGAN